MLKQILTRDDNQIVVAKGITTNNPDIRSFLDLLELDPRLES